MSPYLEDRLKANWKFLFANMPDGNLNIQCGDGWYSIIDVLCESLFNLHENCGEYDHGFLYDVDPSDSGGLLKIYMDPPNLVSLSLTEQFGILCISYRYEYSDTILKLAKMMDGSKAKYPEIANALAHNRYLAHADGCVAYAENLSTRICEFSGLSGVLHRSEAGWYRTLNPEVAKTTYINQGFVPVEK